MEESYVTALLSVAWDGHNAKAKRFSHIVLPFDILFILQSPKLVCGSRLKCMSVSNSFHLCPHSIITKEPLNFKSSRDCSQLRSGVSPVGGLY